MIMIDVNDEIGGWFCYDERSCKARWNRQRSFMTSNMWPDTKQGKGFFLLMTISRFQSHVLFFMSLFSGGHPVSRP